MEADGDKDVAISIIAPQSLLEILGDSPELGHRLLSVGGIAADAMTEMVLDQRPFGICNGALNGLKLHRYIGAGASALDHVDNAAQMTVGAIETLHDCGVRRVGMGMRHLLIIVPASNSVHQAVPLPSQSDQARSRSARYRCLCQKTSAARSLLTF